MRTRGGRVKEAATGAVLSAAVLLAGCGSARETMTGRLLTADSGEFLLIGGDGQAALTVEQTEAIRGILDRNGVLQP